MDFYILAQVRQQRVVLRIPPPATHSLTRDDNRAPSHRRKVPAEGRGALRARPPIGGKVIRDEQESLHALAATHVRSDASHVRTTRAGEPTAMQYGGTLRVTTLAAPI